ncbi:peptide deformylase [bacterium]|nr:MAG: peptide deformylase [bacterium]RKZ15549.1 MAG: peptide deformylase [bacterium]
MPQLLKIARLGHPVLREVARPVDPATIDSPEFQDFIDSMHATMLDNDGVGLAAPQVHVSQRVVVFHEGAGLVDSDDEPITVLINPEITPIGDDQAAMWEGCLSVPGLRGRVTRPAAIEVRALDRHGRSIELELEDFDAVVTQHECDHLDGILYVDHLDSSKHLAFEKEFERFLQEAPVEDDLDEAEESEA